ncbi:MAG TPA: hypothetical protein VLK58_07625, partial [Conexibacter sp.]|nr:hypothetical protein [Conexibacter sp.]
MKVRLGALAAGMFAALAPVPAAAGANGLPAPQGAVREVVGRRTANSTTWELRSGDRVTRIGASPVRWRGADGSWNAFDHTLSLAAGGAAYTAAAGPAQVTLPRTMGDGVGQVAQLTTADGMVRMRLLDAEASGAARDDVVTYRDAFPGVGVTLQAVPEGVKETLTLADATSRRSFAYRLELSAGLRARLTPDGSVTVERDSRGLFELPKPVVTDGATPAATAPVPRYRLSSLGAGAYRVEFALDETWMESSERRFPITVDPTLTLTRTNATTSCFVTAQTVLLGDLQQEYEKSTPDCNNANRPTYNVGIDDTATAANWIYREQGATVTFPPITGYLTNDDVIDSAKLVVYKESEWTGQATGLRAVVGSDASYHDYWRYAKAADSPVRAPVAFNMRSIVSAWQQNRSNATRGFAQGALTITEDAPRSLIVEFNSISETDSYSCLYWVDIDCPEGLVSIASTTHSDVSKRPYLEVTSIQRAASAKVLSPYEGEMTGRRVPLLAHTATGGVSARFQYVAGDRRDWQDIPLEALRYSEPVSGSTVPASREIPFVRSTSGSGVDTIPLVWDLQATPGGDVDGSVHVRAVADGGSSPTTGGVTREVNFRIDRRNPEASASTEIGPGAVNLLTGDFTMASTDVTARAWLSDLSVSRTFHSRGTSTRDAEMFGPHWAASFEADGGAMSYKRLYNYSEVTVEDVTNWVRQPRTYSFEIAPDMPAEPECWEEEVAPDEWETFCEDPPADTVGGYHEFTTEEWTPITDSIRWTYEYAQVELSDGGKITFRRTLNDRGVETGWEPDDGHPGLQMSKSGTTWTLTDEQGATTTFQRDGADSPSYHPTQFQQAGSSQTPSFTWEVAAGRLRLTRVTSAALNPAVNASRYLRFEWGNDASTGSQPRVKRIWFGRWNAAQSTGGTSEVALATYGYDRTGRLTTVVTRASGGLATSYTYDSVGRLAAITPPGEESWRLGYRFSPGDGNAGRLKSITRRRPGSAGDATWTVAYDVPLTGAGAPADMSRATLARWAQYDRAPTDATAIFPPSQVPAEAPVSWTRAVVRYFDVDGNQVNELSPGGALSMALHDDHGNVINELTAANRERAMTEPDTAAAALERMSFNHYDDDGVNLLWTLGPIHTMKIRDTGQVVQGRTRTINDYDNGRPTDGQTYNLPTSRSVLAYYEEGGVNVQADISVTRYDYHYDLAGGGRSNRGWQLRRPTRIITDPGGLNLATSYIYDDTLPLLRERRMPAYDRGGSQSTRFAYYGVDTASGGCTAAAADDAAWSGLPCKRTVDVASGDVAAPVTTFSYDSDWNTTQIADATSGGTRTTAMGHDSYGRPTGTAVTGPGTAVPATSISYSTTTGRQLSTTSAAAGATPARVVTRTFDSNGRLDTYTDATGELTAYSYDADGRLTSTNDTLGATTFGYDDAGNVASVLDSTIGTVIRGARDADGALVRQELPNGVVQETSYDAAGIATAREYVKQDCARSCTWVEDQIVVDAQDRIVEQTTADRARTHSYDRAGRLERVEERTAGSCTTRVYAYDRNSNRTSKTVYPPGTGGACSTSTTPTRQTLVYDSADRLLSGGGSSFSHDVLGRMTRAPAAAVDDELTASYYVNDQPRTLSQDGIAQTYELDPLARTLSRTTSGSASVTEVSHYDGENDAPTWTSDGAIGWTRYVAGVD